MSHWKASERSLSRLSKRLATGAYRRLSLEHLEDRCLLAITVDTHLDVVDVNDGLTSLREAIFAANTAGGADTIDFEPSLTADGAVSIQLTQGEFAITEALSIVGPGPSLLTIDAQLQSRIFNILAATGDFEFSGIAVTNGKTIGSNVGSPHTFSGGAIRSNSSGLLALTEVAITNSSTEGTWAAGGGVFSLGKLRIVESTISGNRTVQGDGAGGSSIGNLEVFRSTISGNAAAHRLTHGGGLSCSGTLYVEASQVIGNYAGNGGGLFGEGLTTVLQSTVSGNTSEVRGGGVWGYGTLKLLSSTIAANQTQGFGGGVYGQKAIIEDCTISGNFAGSTALGGGGIHVLQELTIERSTVVDNRANRRGGGILGGGANMSIRNSIVAMNTATTDGPDIYKPNSFTLQFSLIGNAIGTILVEAPMGTPDSNGNLVGGPVSGVIDPKLGPLVNNGGPTLTHALLVRSPATDVGDPAVVAGANRVPEFDQRGWPWSRVVGGRIDMGAVEAQANPLAGDYNFNGVVDAADYSVWRDTVGSANDFRADGSGAVVGVPDGVVNKQDYEFWKENFGNLLSGQGGSSLAVSQQLAGEDREDSAVQFGESSYELVISIVGDRRALSPRRAVASSANPRHVDDERIEGLVAYLAARSELSRHENLGELCVVDEISAYPESSHAIDDVFASLDAGFGRF